MTNGGEKQRTKALPAWAKKRAEAWEVARKSTDDSFAQQQNESHQRRRSPSDDREVVLEAAALETPAKTNDRVERPNSDGYERKRALSALNAEKDKVHDRLLSSHGERNRRMRSTPERRAEKKEEAISHGERVRRINILLRAGAYDRNRLRRMPETVEVSIQREHQPEENNPSRVVADIIQVKKTDIETWLKALKPHERQRLYVIGRKRFDFKFRPSDYPEYVVGEGDSEAVRAFKEKKLERERIFQEEQKELADALEVVAVPMLRAVFSFLGKDVDVYLASPNDDIAGGIDVVVEFKNTDGTLKTFHDSSPMRLVVDVTYARMRDKITKDLLRGRISKDAYTILKGDKDEVPPTLSNARAMKLFRTVVETLGGNMSTQTFGKDAPLQTPQPHIPRLIIGLDWSNAFSSIANWVEQGEEFEANFKETGLSRRMASSIRNQLVGLHSLATYEQKNPNVPYLNELIEELKADVQVIGAIGNDRSLSNLDQLLTTLSAPLKSWQRRRLFEAAKAQVAYDRASRGGHIRGDSDPVEASTTEVVSLPQYAGGIKPDSYHEIRFKVTEGPSERATKLLEEIQRAWAKSVMGSDGGRYVKGAKGKEDVVWGKYLHGIMERKGTSWWQDKERAYVRTNLPETGISVIEHSKKILPKLVDPHEIVISPSARYEELSGSALVARIEYIKRRLVELESGKRI